MPRSIILSFLLVAAVVDVAAAATRQQICADDQVQRASRSVDSLSSWQKVYTSYLRYGHCDDGAVAEGYSDKIIGLLANRWDLVPELFSLWQAHPLFGRFVLSHVDQLMSPRQATAIVQNARQSCLRASIKYCHLLEQKAQNP